MVAKVPLCLVGQSRAVRRITDPWPFGWGIGLAANAYDVYFADELTEDQIQREMQHLEHHR